MASRAGPNPVQTVARAARFRTARNALVAAGAVLVTAFTVTATVVWPIGQHTPTSCPPNRALVTVHPFALPLDAAGRFVSTSSRVAGRPGRTPAMVGCLDRADLVPAERMPVDPTSVVNRG